MKTAKISQVRENARTYTGKFGEMHIHVVTLAEAIDGQTEWEYHSKSEKCTKFTAGAEATFSTEVSARNGYTNYKITPLDVNKAPGAPSPFRGGGAPKDEGRISALSAASTAAMFYSHRPSAKPEDLLELAEKVYQFALSKSGK